MGSRLDTVSCAAVLLLATKDGLLDSASRRAWGAGRLEEVGCRGRRSRPYKRC